MHSPEQYTPEVPLNSIPPMAPPAFGKVGSNPPPPLRQPGERSTMMGLGLQEDVPLEIGSETPTLLNIKPEAERAPATPEVDINSRSLGGDTEVQKQDLNSTIKKLNVAFEKGLVPQDLETKKALEDLRAAIARNLASL